MVKVARPPVCMKDTGKVWNWRVAKSWIVLVLIVRSCKNLCLVTTQLWYRTGYNCISNTNELHLPVSTTFSVKRIDGMSYTNVFAYSRIVKTTAASNLGVHFFTTSNYGPCRRTNNMKNKNNLWFCHGGAFHAHYIPTVWRVILAGIILCSFLGKLLVFCQWN